MSDLRITPTITETEFRAAVKASDRGFTEDAPLVLLFEPGEYDLAKTGRFISNRAHVRVNASGAIFGNTSIDKQQSFAAPSGAITFTAEGGTVVGVTVSGYSESPVGSEHIWRDWTFRDHDLPQNGMSNSSAEGDTLGLGARLGRLTPNNPWITRLERVTVRDWCGQGNAGHSFYLHGRYGETHVTDSVFAGNRGSSMLKTTRSLLVFKRNKMYTESKMLDGFLPTGYNGCSKMIDLPACSTSIIEGNEFHSGTNSRRNTGTTEIIWLNDRRSLWGNDQNPPYDVTFQRGPVYDVQAFPFTFGLRYADDVEMIINGVPAAVAPTHDKRENWNCVLSPQDTPTTGVYEVSLRSVKLGRITPSDKRIRFTVYRGDDFWCVSSFVEATPDNITDYINADYWATAPEFRHEIRNNLFTWVASADSRPASGLRSRVVRCEGTYPMQALWQFSGGSLWHTTTPGWRERTRIYRSGNTYKGWSEKDRAKTGEKSRFMRTDQQSFRPDDEEMWGPLGLPDPVPQAVIIDEGGETYL